MDKLIVFLDQFNYSYKIVGNSVFVNLEKTFQVEIKFESNKVIIAHKKNSWTMLGGFDQVKFEKTLILNSIFLLIFLFLVLLEVDFLFYEIKMIIAFINIIFYSWFFYYLIKFEIFKSKIEKLLFENS